MRIFLTLILLLIPVSLGAAPGDRKQATDTSGYATKAQFAQYSAKGRVNLPQAAAYIQQRFSSQWRGSTTISSGSVIVSPTAPSNAPDGTIWVDTTGL